MKRAAPALNALRKRWRTPWLPSLMPCQQKAGFKLNAGMRAIADFEFMIRYSLVFRVDQMYVCWVAGGMRAVSALPHWCGVLRLRGMHYTSK